MAFLSDLTRRLDDVRLDYPPNEVTKELPLAIIYGDILRNPDVSRLQLFHREQNLYSDHSVC